MANDQSATVKVSSPQGAERSVYHIKPHDTVDLGALDLGTMRVDLLGADVVLTNTTTKATVVLAQLALYLFSENDAPTLLGRGGEVLTPESMLSHVGKVWEFTARDYLGITSLEKSAEDNDNGEGAKLAEKVEAVEAASAQPVVQNSPAEPKPLEEGGKKFDSLLEMPKMNVGSGMFSTPPRVATEINDTPPADPVTAGLTFTFEARLLQTGVLINNTSPTAAEVRGGGAFETGVFDERNSAQFSQELIDVSAGNRSSYTIYADNPDYFTDTTATRILELTPFMPDGFISKQILITGLPAGYTVTGATDTGSGWLITNPVLSNGAIKLPIVYPTASVDNFTLDINFLASFDASTGLATPAAGEISYTLTREVEVKTVSSVADGNHYDGTGKLIWVMAQNENGTKILGGEKTLTVYGGKGNDDVTAGSGNDTLYGGKGNDILNGGGGDDFLQGGEGNDILIGGTGIDTADYTDKTAAVSIDLAALTAGRSTAYVGNVAEDQLESIENLNGGSGNDTLYGDDANNVLNGGDGNDTLMGRGGNDVLNGGNGNDTVSYAYASNGVTVTLNNGNATVNVAVGDVDTLTSIENIIGSNFDDVLTGDAGTNVLQGGGGNDTFHFSGGSDVIDGGSGTNTLDLSSGTAGATLNLASVNGGGYSTLTLGADTQTVRNIQTVVGTSFNDTLTGSAGNDTIYGGDGNDVIDGGDGNDVIYGGTGNNTLHGGAGTDQLRFDDLATAVTVTLSGAGQGTATSGGATSTFDGFENFYLSNQGDSFTESTGVDRVYGMDGNDTFVMRAADASDDYFDGGLGVDTVDYSAANVALDINLTTGIAAGLGTDTLVSIENVIGGSGNDTIRGSATVANQLDGGGGSNTLTYDHIATTAVVANFASVDANGFATITTGTDVDKVKNFQTVIGGGGNDVFTGNGTGQTFNGGDGNDTFNGSLGNDTFIGGNGVDTVSYAALTQAIGVTLDSSGNATVTYGGVAKDTLQGIENITGGSGNDTITGNSENNILRGGAGNDTIRGGDGDDTIYGGDGNDTLFGDGGNDTFYGDLGNDTIDGGTGYNIMNYSNITSSVAIDLRGTATATGAGIGTDTLTNIQHYVGSTANDTFYGSSGNDSFHGGTGTDLIYGSAGNDAFESVEQADYSSFGVRIQADMATGVIQKDIGNTGSITNTDTFTGGVNQLFTGDYNDVIYGSNAANNIHAGNGDDTIYSSRGSDIINGGGGTDTLYYSNQTGTINANFALGQVTKSIDGTTDTISNIERIFAGTGNDTFQVNDAVLSNLYVNGGNGTDTVRFTGGTLTHEGSAFATAFDNIEILDLRNASLTGGDSFQITAADVIGMTSARSLSMYVTSGFNAAISAGSGYNIGSDVTNGSTRTIVFTRSGESNVTLNVMTYAA